MRPFRLALTLALAVLATGCMGRQLIHLEQGPPGPDQTILLQTVDTKNYWVVRSTKRVFWECAEKGSGLECKKSCDVKDDQGDKLACPGL